MPIQALTPMNINTIIQDINQNVLSYLLAAVFSVLFLIVVDITTKFFKIKRRAKRKIKTETPILNDLQDQLKIISCHASKYSNSLGNEGAKLIYELNSIIENQNETLEMLQIFLESGSIEDLEQFYTEFDELTPKQKTRWITRAHDIIQLLGTKIHEVSEKSSNAGIPKANKRESTIADLKRLNLIK